VRFFWAPPHESYGGGVKTSNVDFEAQTKNASVNVFFIRRSSPQEHICFSEFLEGWNPLKKNFQANSIALCGYISAGKIEVPIGSIIRRSLIVNASNWNRNRGHSYVSLMPFAQSIYCCDLKMLICKLMNWIGIGKGIFFLLLHKADRFFLFSCGII